jgi:hypothetical protein
MWMRADHPATEAVRAVHQQAKGNERPGHKIYCVHQNQKVMKHFVILMNGESIEFLMGHAAGGMLRA